MDRYSDLRFLEIDRGVYSEGEERISTERVKVNPKIDTAIKADIQIAIPEWVLILPIADDLRILDDQYLRITPFSLPVALSYRCRSGTNEANSPFIVHVNNIDLNLEYSATIKDQVDGNEDDDSDLGDDEGAEEKIPPSTRGVQVLNSCWNFNLVKYVKIPAKSARLSIWARLGNLESKKCEVELRLPRPV